MTPQPATSQCTPRMGVVSGCHEVPMALRPRGRSITARPSASAGMPWASCEPCSAAGRPPVRLLGPRGQRCGQEAGGEQREAHTGTSGRPGSWGAETLEARGPRGTRRGCPPAPSPRAATASAVRSRSALRDDRHRAERLIAALAIIGLSSSPKNGIEHARRRSARRARCRRTRRTGSGGCCASCARLSRRRASDARAGRPCTSVTPALSMATSVPVPMAMPTSACGQRRARR